jgi:hypothetical protein
VGGGKQVFNRNHIITLIPNARDVQMELPKVGNRKTASLGLLSSKLIQQFYFPRQGLGWEWSSGRPERKLHIQRDTALQGCASKR